MGVAGPWGMFLGPMEAGPGRAGWVISWRAIKAQGRGWSFTWHWGTTGTSGAGQGCALRSFACACVCTLRVAGGSGVEVEKPGLGAKVIQGRGLTQGRQGRTGG